MQHCPPPRAILAALLAVLAVPGAACSLAGGSTEGRPNVVLICLDTVRADHLGSYGYSRPTTPAIDALAGRALVFTRASATAGWTKPSVPSFLTGTYPCQHGVYEGSAFSEAGEVTDLLPAEALTLAEAFQQSGYGTAAFVHNAQLRAGNGFEQGFEVYQQAELDARALRWHGLDWLDARGASGDARPFFLYLHFLDAHWPYSAPEEWVTRFAPAQATQRFRGRESRALYSAINAGEHVMTADDRAALVALYDGALAYLDSELGRLFAGLELRGLAADTIVCIVADHGEEFGEHGKVGHGHGLWESLLHVPWILAVPGRGAERHDGLVSLIDLFPTLLAAAGIEPPAGHEGVDRLAEPRAARAILAEHKAPDRYFQTLRVGDEKLLRGFRPPPGGAEARRAPSIAPGTRWEAELALVGGELVATQLKPRDEETSELPELKGLVEAATPSEFRIAGIRVRYDEDTKRQTDVGTSGPELANGQVVKARGALEQGALAAERIKFYAPGEDARPEIRGTVESFDPGASRLSLSGFAIRVGPETELEDGVERSERHLTRNQVVDLLLAGAGFHASANGYESTRELFDLARDRGESAPRPVEPGTVLDGQLDQLASALVRTRIFGASDQKALDATALRELQEIGYAGDGR
jgi:arylsulfatase